MLLEPENTVFISGKDSNGNKGGSIIFYAGNDPESKILEFTSNGEFIYKGAVIRDANELYSCFTQWLAKANKE